MELFSLPFGGYVLGVIVFFILYQWRAKTNIERNKRHAFESSYKLLSRLDKRLTAWMTVVGVLITISAVWMVVLAYQYGQKTFELLRMCVNG